MVCRLKDVNLLKHWVKFEALAEISNVALMLKTH